MCNCRISHVMSGALSPLCNFLDCSVEGAEVLMQLRGTFQLAFLEGLNNTFSTSPKSPKSWIT